MRKSKRYAHEIKIDIVLLKYSSPLNNRFNRRMDCNDFSEMALE